MRDESDSNISLTLASFTDRHTSNKLDMQTKNALRITHGGASTLIITISKGEAADQIERGVS
jgi:hypothetical protein